MGISKQLNRLMVGLGSLLVILILTSAGCVSTTGPSSEDMKKQLMSTAYYRSVKQFYSAGLRNRSPLGRVDTKNIRIMEAELQSSSDKIFYFIKNHEAVLKKYFPQIKTASKPPTVRITNTNSPIAMVTRDGNIELDVRILQSLFVGALAYSSVDNADKSFFSESNSDPVKLVTLDQDQQLKIVQSAIGITDSIDKTKGHSHLGDAIGIVRELSHESSDFEKSAWFSLADIQMKSIRLEGCYLQARGFLLAHEIAHIVLGHYQNDQSIDSNASMQMEYDADKFAIVLVSPNISDSQGGSMQRGLIRSIIGSMDGFATYLAYSYNLIEFHEGKTNDRAYPEAQARLDRAYAEIEELNAIQEEYEKNAIAEWEKKYGSR